MKSFGLFFTGIALAAQSLTFELHDYLTMPDPGKRDPKSQNSSSYSRVSTLREEPGPDRDRYFISDISGPIYILDKKTKQLTTYLNINGKPGHNGYFRRLMFEIGFNSGLISFQFDPDYRRNGRFYTIHLEDPAVSAPVAPDLKGYEPSAAIPTPGDVLRESVIVEWTDTNTSNNVFEGTARELMRIKYNTHIHPVGDLIFNPTARPGDTDWRVLYIACGDGGSGEKKDPAQRHNPQRLDNLAGKILRIIPDLNEHTTSSVISENGRYRVPRDNPFVSKSGARPEIWAYGLRNPHRLSWDVDPADRKKNFLITEVIGLGTWETVVIVKRGANYGYSEREGNEQLLPTNRTGPLPADDRIPLRIGETPTEEMITPTYPVLQYGHVAEGGDAISSGLVYRGKIAALRGKYIFGDITTGRLWWADLKEMLAADDGNPKTMAAIHPIQLLWGPAGKSKERYPSMAPIASAAYHARGGEAEYLPGFGARISKGRADIRLAMDRDGRLFVISKSDGMIREVVGVVGR